MRKEKVALWFDEDELLNVFDRPKIKKESDKIFKNINFLIRYQMDNILDDIYSYNDDFNVEILREDVYDEFKKFFHIYIIKKAITYLLVDAAESDSIISSLLTEQNLIYAIYGDPMKNAFSKVINRIPVGSSEESCLYGRVIRTVEEAFSVNSII